MRLTFLMIPVMPPAFDWYQNGSNVDPEHRTLTADGCFKDAEEIEDLDFFEWPDPEKYIDG